MGILMVHDANGAYGIDIETPFMMKRDVNYHTPCGASDFGIVTEVQWYDYSTARNPLVKFYFFDQNQDQVATLNSPCGVPLIVNEQ